MAPASDPAAFISLKSLPLGFRFHPTDEELVNHYLKRKINGRIDRAAAAIIPVVDVCKFEPWDLKHMSAIQSDDPEWFFFAARDRKYSSGQRANRATKAGYWKATGKDRKIKSRNGVKGGSLVVVGMKRTLVFHRGRAPKGKRTCWIMHEYRTIQEEFESGYQEGYVLCRLFEKTEEKSSDSSPKTDEIENNDNSPSLSEATNKKDDLEEVVRLSCKKSPELHYNEEKALPAASPQEILPWCNNNIVSNSADHDGLEVTGEGDSLLNARIECDAEEQQLGSWIFPKIVSPIPPCNDYSLLDNYNAPLNHMFLDVEEAEDDSMTNLLAAMFSNQEEYYPEVSSSHVNQFANNIPSSPVDGLELQGDSPQESKPAQESTSSRDYLNLIAFEQDSDRSFEPDFSSKNSVHSMTAKRSIHANQNVQHRGLMVPAVDSIQSRYALVGLNNQEIINDRGICYAGSGMASCIHQISQHSSNMDEAISTMNVDENGFSSVGTGITIRSCQPQHHSENAVLKQGDAFRRIRLQNSFHVGSLLNTNTESSSSNLADLQDEVSSVEDHELAESYTTGKGVSKSSYKNRRFYCSDDGDEEEVSSNIRTDDDTQLKCRPKNAGSKMGGIFVNLKTYAPISSPKIFATCSMFMPVAYLTLVLAVLVPCIGAWWNFR